MEEHRSGGTRPFHKSSALGLKPGTARVNVELRQILIDCPSPLTAIMDECIRALGGAVCSVSLACEDVKQGRQIAQAFSCRHYPMSASKTLEYLSRDNIEPDSIIRQNGNNLEIEFRHPHSRSTISPIENTEHAVFAKSAARLALFLCLEDAAPMRGKNYRINPNGSSSEIADTCIESQA